MPHGVLTALRSYIDEDLPESMNAPRTSFQIKVQPESSRYEMALLIQTVFGGFSVEVLFSGSDRRGF